MCAKIVVLNKEPAFLHTALNALTEAGHYVSSFSDPMVALDAMAGPLAVDLLVVGGAFGAKKPHGLSVALVTRSWFPRIKILFTVGADLAGPASDLGEVIPAGAGARELLAAVHTMLSPGKQRARTGQVLRRKSFVNKLRERARHDHQLQLAEDRRCHRGCH